MGERWVHLLIQKLWGVDWDQWDPRSNLVHNQENVVTQLKAAQLNGWIDGEIRTDIGLLSMGDTYFLLNLSMKTALQWTLTRKQWKRFDEMVWTPYQDIPV
jgi:hypothetical protein